MTTLRFVVLSVGTIVIVPFIIAAFLKQRYTLQKEIIIDKPKEIVFNYIKYLKNQDSYSKWALMDPTMTKVYSGTDGTVGFVSAWDSNDKNVGKGEQEIVKIIEGERIDYQLRFIKPFKSTESTYMQVEFVNNSQTRIVWGFDGHMNYPLNLLMLFMNFEKMIGSDLEIGLKNLKNILEKQ